MSLFSALLPPADVVESLTAELAGHGGDPRLRWSEPGQWHVTLGFYGEGDPVARAAWLAGRLAGRPAPRVRLRGPGTFPGVLWLGVEGEGLAELAGAAGSGLEDREYRPHLTLARFRLGQRADGERWERALSGFGTGFWTVGRVVLMATDHGGGGPANSPYRVIESWSLR